ncbi:uncharacterized protein MELLADRAFT_65495 [Melampsora larici-populina 98AG31]|uniref:Uncharacterized protein n=1 Tax=Melampsora larici-populina (strain 98AG31 / pathotype 3-4-7) TaxID=747676 RepID=F4RVM6_MELLP|nr:uncharacterized protein MELLADRAFT_65495 [Melampsora larici-populina 98AG31]EGG03382.1 hypothetical protein MELLADRAFT_65495 [Melampsora larici-populina 98AG31]
MSLPTPAKTVMRTDPYQVFGLFTKSPTPFIPQAGLTDGAIRVVGNDFIAWYSNQTDIVLENELPEAIRALGHVPHPLCLRANRTYQLAGPFSQDPNSGEAMMSFGCDTQTFLGFDHLPPAAVAGKTLINGIGKVLDFHFDDVENCGGLWNLTVNLNHEFYDPVQEHVLEFTNTCVFGYMTLPALEWTQINTGTTMMIYGTVGAKDPVSNRFIVQVLDYACLGNVPEII